MQSLLVYADFDWLESPLLVGTLNYELLRGNDSYGFSFGPITNRVGKSVSD